MESVDLWEDSQYDSMVEYDASMNPFVKDSICLDEELLVDEDEEDEEHVVDEDEEHVVEEQVQDECMIVEDTFDREELRAPVGPVEEDDVKSMIGNGKIAEQKVKDGVIKVNDDAEIIVIDDEDIVVIDDFDQEVIVVQDRDEEKGLKSTKSPCHSDIDQPSVEDFLLPTNDNIDRDFDLNKLPLSGLLKFTDPSVEKGFIEMLRKYQSKYY